MTRNKRDELASSDRDYDHCITVERRTEWPPVRVSCTCGFDQGWQASLIAEQDAEMHRDEVAAALAEEWSHLERDR